MIFRIATLHINAHREEFGAKCSLQKTRDATIRRFNQLSCELVEVRVNLLFERT